MKGALGLLALFAAGLAAALAVAASGRDAVACVGVTTNDVFCRTQTKLTVTPAPGVVTTSTGYKMTFGSTAATNTTGTAKLYFLKQAACNIIAVAGGTGTSLLTRRPLGFLFTQSKGKTQCTMKNGSIVTVTGAKQLKPAAARAATGRAEEEPFYALLESVTGTTQFRADFVPARSFAVATRVGALLVRLPFGVLVPLGPGRELLIAINPDGSVGTRKQRQATFTAEEVKIFESQRLG